MKKIFSLTILSLVFAEGFSQKLPVAKIVTPEGEILVWLYDRTPMHKKSFMALARAHYWDSLTFNRVVPDFVNQGGCPDTPQGFTDTSMLLAPEIVKGLTHIYGAVGAGRDNNPQKNSARCQFYIVQNKNGVHRLDGDYTVFGQVLQGMDVVEKIAAMPRDKHDGPLQKVYMKVAIVYLKRKWVERMTAARFFNPG